jgi:hypothetical protein
VQEIVGALVDAKRCLANAWQILDGTDGAASGVEQSINAALAGIGAIYAIEHVNAYNADVASPVAVQEFWDKHGELPGFAIGTSARARRSRRPERVVRCALHGTPPARPRGGRSGAQWVTERAERG